MSKCECKVIRKFALETKKSMYSLCPIDKANKPRLWLTDVMKVVQINRIK